MLPQNHALLLAEGEGKLIEKEKVHSLIGPGMVFGDWVVDQERKEEEEDLRLEITTDTFLILLDKATSKRHLRTSAFRTLEWKMHCTEKKMRKAESESAVLENVNVNLNEKEKEKEKEEGYPAAITPRRRRPSLNSRIQNSLQKTGMLLEEFGVRVGPTPPRLQITPNRRRLQHHQQQPQHHHRVLKESSPYVPPTAAARKRSLIH